MACEERRISDLTELAQPMEQTARVLRQREILALLDLQVLYLLLLRFHLLSQWLDDGIGQDVAGFRGDVGSVLATAGDCADDGRPTPPPPTKATSSDVQNSVFERSNGGIGSPMGRASSTAVPEPSGRNHMNLLASQVRDAMPWMAEIEFDLSQNILLKNRDMEQ